MLNPVISYLRKLGFLSSFYLDDFLLLGISYEESLKNVSTTVAFLEKLGFIINYKKSNLTPSQNCKYLGFIYDSTKMTLKLPEDKIKRVKQLVNLKLDQKIKIRKFAKILGVVVSCCPAVEYSWLYTKASERVKFLALEANSGSYEKSMKISRHVLEELQWWKQLNNASICHIRNSNYELEIFSDASLTGWVVSCNGYRANGHWKEKEKSNFINHLELLAAYFGLKIFAKDNRESAILLHIDNTTAISYIHRMGGIQYPKLNSLAKKIWQWCEKRKIWICATYIASRENREDDTESRRLQSNTEIEISNVIFEKIVALFGKPKIDLFASRSNAKCKRYVSWKRDPESIAIDAFTISWSDHYLYAFPPCSIILRTLQKIKTDAARGIMIVPEWPGQPWYPIFCSMLVSETFETPAKEGLVFSGPSMDLFWNKTTLVAGILSGKV
ncbi:uncharacterized protein LOC103316100 [Nasonia vitripennis]|uniref:Reverse transcriptase domain-containing protein n=1 Tax=Nasonia vitripennis TaxID=7425 RepID=A0A7M7H9V7_NASVI|nr:uncharacterized protein LOC103316100 [Nasonia vitripennis]